MVLTLQNNEKLVMKKLDGLKKMLLRDDRLQSDYCEIMLGITKNGNAEEVPQANISRKRWLDTYPIMMYIIIKRQISLEESLIVQQGIRVLH